MLPGLLHKHRGLGIAVGTKVKQDSDGETIELDRATVDVIPSGGMITLTGYMPKLNEKESCVDNDLLSNFDFDTWEVRRDLVRCHPSYLTHQPNPLPAIAAVESTKTGRVITL